MHYLLHEEKIIKQDYMKNVDILALHGQIINLIGLLWTHLTSQLDLSIMCIADFIDS